MAELKNCRQCGQVFASQGSSLCRKCFAKVDEEFTIVRKYVREHNGADVIEVAQATGVKEETILQFVREGRLLTKGFIASLTCERCSARINKGRFCARCAYELNHEIEGVLATSAGPAESLPVGREQMHIYKQGK